MANRGKSYSEPVDGQAVYACVAVEDLPVPYVASEKSTCDGCGRETWFDPRSYELARQIAIKETGKPNVFVQCSRCGDRWMRSLAAAQGVELPANRHPVQ